MLAVTFEPKSELIKFRLPSPGYFAEFKVWRSSGLLDTKRENEKSSEGTGKQESERYKEGTSNAGHVP